MTRSELADALVLGLSRKNNGEIGRFGLGLKTACTSLGSAFQVRTAPSDGKVEWVADYDEDEFLASGEWALPIRRQSREREAGTSVFVYSTRVYSGLSKSLFRNLGSTFRHFIDDGVIDLTINDEKVGSVHQEIDRDSILPLEGEVAGHKVRGWVGLLQASSQRGWYGFSLVRHRRVIRRHEKLGFRPHPSSARVVGELHLDDFPVNNLKTDFIRETDAWRELEGWISSSIEPILAVSRALAHAGSFDTAARSAIAAERERILAALGPADVVLPPPATQASTRSGVVNVVLGTNHLAHRFESAGSTEPHFRLEQVAREHEQDLTAVFTNVDHPAMTANDPSQIACHNVAEAAALDPDYISAFVAVKGHFLTALLNQKEVRRALRSSAKQLHDAEVAPAEPEAVR
jgi:hypothetical protein